MISNASPIPESRNVRVIAPLLSSHKETVTKTDSSYSPIKVHIESPNQVKSKTQETNDVTISLRQTTKVQTPLNKEEVKVVKQNSYNGTFIFHG